MLTEGRTTSKTFCKLTPLPNMDQKESLLKNLTVDSMAVTGDLLQKVEIKRREVEGRIRLYSFDIWCAG